MIRILVVEDSITQREIFRRLFAADGQFTVVAEAATGREAVAMVQKYLPDVVLMDIHMPDMDGIAATREIMRLCPVPIVVASATLRRHEVDLAMKALEAGAVSVIEKPEGAVLLHLHKIEPQLRHELLAAASVKMPRRVVSAPVESTAAPASGWPTNVEVIGVCASTGGPPVLVEIFSALPKPFPLPVLVVQHISEGFVEGFARWLGETTGHPTRLANGGERLEPGLWLATGGRHLALGGRARLDIVPRRENDLHCPSGNVLFESLSRQGASRAMGILLTGMGDDGATGLASLKKAGGFTVIQNEATSLIWGMPKTAQQLGAAMQELSPRDIARVMIRVANSFPRPTQKI